MVLVVVVVVVVVVDVVLVVGSAVVVVASAVVLVVDSEMEVCVDGVVGAPDDVSPGPSSPHAATDATATTTTAIIGRSRIRVPCPTTGLIKRDVQTHYEPPVEHEQPWSVVDELLRLNPSPGA